MSASVVCSLFVHHMFPHSNCHLHAQILSSHGCTYGYSAQGHPGLLLLQRRLARRQPQWCTTSGGLKNTEQAKHLVETDGTPAGTPMCYLAHQIAPQHGKGNSAQPCVHILSSPEGHRETMNKERRLELKQLSLQARPHAADCSAVRSVPSLWVDQFAL